MVMVDTDVLDHCSARIKLDFGAAIWVGATHTHTSEPTTVCYINYTSTKKLQGFFMIIIPVIIDFIVHYYDDFFDNDGADFLHFKHYDGLVSIVAIAIVVLPLTVSLFLVDWPPQRLVRMTIIIIYFVVITMIYISSWLVATWILTYN